MRGLINGLIIFSVLTGLWSPLSAVAADTAGKGSDSRVEETAALSDDIAVCADDPAPDMSGRNFGLAGKPVNLLSGVEGFSRTDLTIGSVFPISVARRYDSRASYDSPVGYGWAGNYDRRLYTYSDGSVTLRKECGWKRRFTRSGSSYVSPIGETGTLVKNADNSYTYTYKSGEQDNYDSRGRLASRIDTKGHSVVVYYELDVRSPLWGILPANVSQATLVKVAYDYRVSRIEEKDASGALTNKYVLFHYDGGTGRLTDIVDYLGRTVTYSHDGSGNLTGVAGPSGTMSYGYNDSASIHRMTSVNEGQGEYKNEYDDQGRVKKQTHGTGVIDFEYLEPHKKTRVTTTIKDSAGNVLNTQTRTTEYGDLGQPGRVTDTFGNVIVYSRDSNGRITREEYWENAGTVDAPNLGLKTQNEYAYDSSGNMTQKTEALSTSLTRTTTYQYYYEKDPAATAALKNKLWKEIKQSVVFPDDPAKQKITTYDYYENGNVKTLTETGYSNSTSAYTYTTTYEYYSDGKLKKTTGPRGDVTYYEYDAGTGYLQYLTRAYGTSYALTTTYADWDGLGNPRTVTDPNGAVTTYTYDDLGRVTTTKAPGDTAATQYFYVESGCSSCGGGANKIDYILLPLGNKIDYDYDAFGNLSTITDNVGNSINYTYDSEGNRLTEEIKDSTGALQKTLSYQYDALNRLKRTNNPDASYTEYDYDMLGNRTSVKDPNGSTTSYEYDALSRLKTVTQPGAVTTSYGYTSANNLKTVTDDNNAATTYQYDDMGRVYRVNSPDTGATTYWYDQAGNLTGKYDAKGVTISYQYDLLNRLTKIDFPADTDIEYAYDAYKDGSACLNGKGRLCEMTDASGTTKYEYTQKGQAKTETKTIDSRQYISKYTFDQNGNLKTMTYHSGRIVTYSYADVNDRVTSVVHKENSSASNVTIANSIQYKPFGGMKWIKYANSLTSGISYDTQYRVTAMNTGAVLKLSYNQYDANGNIKQITNTLDSARNRSFTYDALDRLDTATATGLWGVLDWSYDGVGNRQTENTTAYTYVANTNKLSTVGGVSFGFDNNGNTTAEGARQFIYNQNQRLTSVVDSGTTKGEYTYNGNGQRVKKVANGQTTILHYNQNGQIISESNSSGTITAEYVYLNGQPLAKIEGGSTYYYHNDHLGTPQKMTDSSGDVVWAADYKPFGEATITVSTITNNLRFPGQYFDAETGLHQNWNRDYNPAIGSYAEADPMGILEGTNQIYVYARNNSLRYKDPLGLDTAGCDGVPDWLETPCRLECCAQHDECFKKNNCTSKSWTSKCSSNCDKCNDDVKDCIKKCKFTDKDDPDKPNYYCARLGKYISLKDHDYKYAKKFCESK